LHAVRAGLVGLGAAALAGLGLMAATGDPVPGPGFEIHGYASATVGGSRGTLVRVTSLDGGTGPGTLRDAVSRPNRRIEFAVAGDIVIHSDLVISQPNLTIDGSTAPRGGVQIRGGSRVVLAADELILRHVRIRPGPHPQGYEADCVTVDRGTNVVIDHVSCSWATDEGISSWGRVAPVRNLTVQWSIISEGLLCPPVNRPKCLEDGMGYYGSLFEGDLDGLTLYRNLYAHNVNRNPLILDGPLRAPPRYEPPATVPDVVRTAHVQIIQNVIYHYLYGTQLSSQSRRGVLVADEGGGGAASARPPPAQRPARPVPARQRVAHAQGGRARLQGLPDGHEPAL
jgi:hypothetical protein